MAIQIPYNPLDSAAVKYPYGYMSLVKDCEKERVLREIFPAKIAKIINHFVGKIRFYQTFYPEAPPPPEEMDAFLVSDAACIHPLYANLPCSLFVFPVYISTRETLTSRVIVNPKISIPKSICKEGWYLCSTDWIPQSEDLPETERRVPKGWKLPSVSLLIHASNKLSQSFEDFELFPSYCQEKMGGRRYVVWSDVTDLFIGLESGREGMTICKYFPIKG